MKNVDWFSTVEIEVNSRCNRKCGYCPVSVLPTPITERFMSTEVFDRIVSELGSIDFRGTLSYHLFNEPLLRRDLEVLAAEVAMALPDVFQLLFTNGDLLSDERYRTLKAAGIDYFIVTRHDFSPIVERPDQKVLLPSDLVFANRGGFFAPLTEPLSMPCYAPTDMLIITVDGDVLLCCDDAERRYVMGNILRQSLEEIWLAPTFVAIRNLLQAGNRADASDICRQCNNREYFGRGENDHQHLGKERRTV
jgi:2-deoxy-scyllo-inosamine dehydrogenase (SAM-dependent)